MSAVSQTMITCGGGVGVSGLMQALATSRREHRLLIGQIEDSLTLGAVRCGEVVQIPRAEDPAYLETMQDLCRSFGVGLLIPVFDGELETLAVHADRFAAEGTRVLVGDAATVRLCLDKAAFMGRMAALELPVPRSRRVRTVEELITSAAKMGFPEEPLCIKPVRGMGGRGFHILRSEYDRFAAMFSGKSERIVCTLEEVCVALEQAPGGGADLLLMEYAPGEQFSVDCVDGGGRALAGRRGSKTGPAGRGVSLRVDIGEHAEAETVVGQVVELLNLDGPLNFDLRRAANGRLVVLEVNPRISAHVGFTSRRIHLLDLAVDVLLDEPQPIRTYLRSDERMIGLRYFSDLTVSASEAGRLIRDAALESPVAVG